MTRIKMKPEKKKIVLRLLTDVVCIACSKYLKQVRLRIFL